MPAFDIVTTGPNVHSDNFDICKAVMVDQGFKVNIISDKLKAVKLGMGAVNPSNGFIIIAPTGEVLLNYMQLFRYMERKGLIRI